MGEGLSYEERRLLEYLAAEGPARGVSAVPVMPDERNPLFDMHARGLVTFESVSPRMLRWSITDAGRRALTAADDGGEEKR